MARTVFNLGSWGRFGKSIASLSKGLYSGFSQSPNIDIGTVEEALADMYVHSAVRIVASSLAQCDWSCPENKNFNTVLHEPNDWQTQYEWIHSNAISMMSYGSAPQEVIRAGERISALLPLDSPSVTVNSTEQGMPVYDLLGAEGAEARQLTARECMYLIDVPTLYVQAVSRVEAARKRIRMLLVIDDILEEGIKNSLYSPYILSTVKKLEDDERQRRLDEFVDNILEKKARATFLDSDIEFKREKLGAPIDPETRTLREDFKREIAACLGVPPFLIGGETDTKYNNFSASMNALHQETLYPMIVNTKQRLQKFAQAEIEVDISAIVNGDWQTTVETVMAQTGKPVLTQNEGREDLGRERIDNPEYDKLGTALPGGTPAPKKDRRGEFPSDTGRNDGPQEKGLRVV